MDQLLDQARSIYEGEIDFAGQRLAEYLSTILLTVTGVLAFLTGFITQNILHTMYVGLGGTAMTFLIVAPPWPFYNQTPEPFLPARVPKGREAELRGVNVEGLTFN